MTQDDSEKKKSTADSLADIFKNFGEAMSEIFNDPELKEKAGRFGEDISSSARALGDRLRDEEVKTKFRDVGKAAEEFGKNVAEIFESKE